MNNKPTRNISAKLMLESFNIANQDIRKAVPTAQEPLLYENGSNLSAVLFHLMTGHYDAFDALQTHLMTKVPLRAVNILRCSSDFARCRSF